MEFSNFPVDDLAQRCAEESTKKASVPRDDRFCFELVRRAFRLDEPDAMGHVFNVYKDTWSRRWVYDSHLFDNHAQTMEDFKNIAFWRVHKKMTGQQFDKFPALKAILDYMQKTLAHVIAEYLRKDKKIWKPTGQEDDDLDDLFGTQPTTPDPALLAEINIVRQKIVERVAHLLPEEDDHLYYWCAMQQGMKRNEIVAEYPERWNDHTARVTYQHIRRKIDNDPILIALLRDFNDLQNNLPDD